MARFKVGDVVVLTKHAQQQWPYTKGVIYTITDIVRTDVYGTDKLDPKGLQFQIHDCYVVSAEGFCDCELCRYRRGEVELWIPAQT